MDLITDIVVTTRNRLDYLKQTLAYIYERTRSPYWLHVIDDQSTEGNVEYLLKEWRAGRVHHLLLHGKRVGQMANANQATWMTFSDPVVLTDDDVLCPDVEPDWLARGLAAMRKHPRVALLAPNQPAHPHRNRQPLRVDGDVTFCKAVGGTFMFVRRPFLLKAFLLHRRDHFGIRPTTKRCARARKRGLQIAYLSHTYCQHIGEWSALTNEQFKYGRPVGPVDPITLEPVDPRWRK